MNVADWFKFAFGVLPEAYKLAKDIYQDVSHDKEEAIRNIKDRRSEIAEKRKKVDEALRDKYRVE